MHVVIMGCGRVGSTLAHSLETSRATRSRHRPGPTAFRRLGPDFGGRTVTGIGFDRDTPASRPGSRGRTRSPRSPAATTPTSSPPGWPGRRSASSNVVARIYDPAPRRGLRAARHPDRRDVSVDRPTGCCAGCCPSGVEPSGATRAAGRRHPEVHARPRPGSASGSPSSRTRPAPGSRSSPGSARAMLPDRRHRAAGRRPACTSLLHRRHAPRRPRPCIAGRPGGEH